MIASTTSRWVVSLRLNSRDGLTEPEHRDVVRDLEDVAHVVGDEDHRQALIGQSPGQVEHLAGLGDAECGGRLVEHDELRIPQHRLGHRDRLALAAGHRRDRQADVLQRRDREVIEHLARPGLHLRLVEAEETRVQLPAEVHVLDDVEVVGERQVLVDDLDAETGRLLGAGDGHRLPLPDQLALIDRVDPGDALDQGRLAGAVVADEGHDLAVGRAQVRATQGVDRAEALEDSLRLQQVRFAHRSLSSLVGPGATGRRPLGRRPVRSGVYLTPYFVHRAA